MGIPVIETLQRVTAHHCPIGSFEFRVMSTVQLNMKIWRKKKKQLAFKLNTQLKNVT